MGETTGVSGQLGCHWRRSPSAMLLDCRTHHLDWLSSLNGRACRGFAGWRGPGTTADHRATPSRGQPRWPWHRRQHRWGAPSDAQNAAPSIPRCCKAWPVPHCAGQACGQQGEGRGSGPQQQQCGGIVGRCGVGDRAWPVTRSPAPGTGPAEAERPPGDRGSRRRSKTG